MTEDNMLDQLAKQDETAVCHVDQRLAQNMQEFVHRKQGVAI